MSVDRGSRQWVRVRVPNVDVQMLFLAVAEANGIPVALRGQRCPSVMLCCSPDVAGAVAELVRRLDICLTERKYTAMKALLGALDVPAPESVRSLVSDLEEQIREDPNLRELHSRAQM